MNNPVPKYPITSLILDFRELKRAHTGLYLAEQLCTVLKEYDIEEKVCRLHFSVHLNAYNYIGFKHSDRQRLK
jgi:hypothetical protein